LNLSLLFLQELTNVRKTSLKCNRKDLFQLYLLIPLFNYATNP
jgi:hypothetical protein